MAVGENRHCRIAEIHGRHFLQTGERAGLPKPLVRAAIEEVHDTAGEALQKVEEHLPTAFPGEIHASVKAAVLDRIGTLRVAETA